MSKATAFVAGVLLTSMSGSCWRTKAIALAALQTGCTWAT